MNYDRASSNYCNLALLLVTGALDYVYIHATADILMLIVVQIPEFSAASRLHFAQVAHKLAVVAVYSYGSSRWEVVKGYLAGMARIWHYRVRIDYHTTQVRRINCILGRDVERC